jgi:hypothetical protein
MARHITVAVLAAAGWLTQPAAAQTGEIPRAWVDAGESVIVLPTVPPKLLVVPIRTPAKVVTAGPILRVSGCTWARERRPGGWIRFRVCS